MCCVGHYYEALYSRGSVRDRLRSKTSATGLYYGHFLRSYVCTHYYGDEFNSFKPYSVPKTMETILNPTLSFGIPGGRPCSLSVLPCELVKTAFNLNVIQCKCLEIVIIQLIQSIWFTLIRSVATSKFDCLFYPD